MIEIYVTLNAEGFVDGWGSNMLDAYKVSIDENDEFFTTFRQINYTVSENTLVRV